MGHESNSVKSSNYEITLVFQINVWVEVGNFAKNNKLMSPNKSMVKDHSQHAKINLNKR